MLASAAGQLRRLCVVSWPVLMVLLRGLGALLRGFVSRLCRALSREVP